MFSEERACRICLCTDLRACLHPDGTPCAWVDNDLCSLCADLMATPALEDIATERARQVQQEGWTSEHDDAHARGELALAAAGYAEAAGNVHRDIIADFRPSLPFGWPWDPRWWKPTDRRRDLVKAGALILAEIERIDRQIERGSLDPAKEAQP